MMVKMLLNLHVPQTAIVYSISKRPLDAVSTNSAYLEIHASPGIRFGAPAYSPTLLRPRVRLVLRFGSGSTSSTGVLLSP